MSTRKGKKDSNFINHKKGGTIFDLINVFSLELEKEFTTCKAYLLLVKALAKLKTVGIWNTK